MIAIPDFSEIDVVFPTHALKILPPYADIPDEFKRDSNKWTKVVRDWFYRGLNGCKWTPKEGVDTNKALRAVSVCIGDWSPKHEHKMAGCAYLLSQWFDDVTYTAAK